MNVNDLETVLFRLKMTLRFTGHLHSLRDFYTNPRMEIDGEPLTFTDTMKKDFKAQAKQKFDKLATRLRLAVDKLEPIGTPDQKTLDEIQEAPARVFNALQNLLQQGSEIVQSVGDRGGVDAAGDYVSLELGPEPTTQTANALATIQTALNWWIDQEQAKLT